MFQSKKIVEELSGVIDQKDAEIERLEEDLRKSYANLSTAMDEASLHRDPVKVHLTIDFKNLDRKKRGMTNPNRGQIAFKRPPVDRRKGPGRHDL